MSDERNVHATTHGAGFDEAEPQAFLILIFGIGTIITLLAVMFAVEWYFDRVNEEVTYEMQLGPVSVDLTALRADEDLRLHTYGYINKDKTEVRIPIERAMDVVVAERSARAATDAAKPVAADVKPVVK